MRANPQFNPLIYTPLGWGIALFGRILYGFAVPFSLVTLPVEYNASHRAMAALGRWGIITSQEYDGTRKVLDAAARTYVAATIGAITTLLYYGWMMFGAAEE